MTSISVCISWLEDSPDGKIERIFGTGKKAAAAQTL